MAQTKRQEQKEMTHHRIIDTAFRLYASKGFSVSTKTIAQEAGISHGAVFVHFPTRGDLERAVLEQFASEIGQRLHQLSEENTSLREMLFAHIAVLEDYEAFYKNLITETASLPYEMKMTFVSVQTVLSSHYSEIIEKERRNGSIKDIPLHMLFNTWIGLVHYYLLNSELFAPGGSVLKRCKNELVESYLALTAK